MKYETLVLDEDQKLCKIDEEDIILTRKEYDLLLLFLTQPNKIHTREELISAVWDKEISPRTVDNTILRLRKKIGKYSNNIVTRMGFGYGFKMN